MYSFVYFKLCSFVKFQLYICLMKLDDIFFIVCVLSELQQILIVSLNVLCYFNLEN